ncbi:hypothetical protein M3Y97_00218100 [Aphelenchoides bicaudatus]|nr:hypothetical protein M3Y97_00218100 [Aphelenchoides bicaudatus]
MTSTYAEDDQLGEPPINFGDVPIDKLNPLASSNSPAPLIQGSIPKETAILTHASLHGLSKEKAERIRSLYERLDLDNDGTINIRDLSRALQKEANHIPTNYAGRILQRISREDKDEIDFSEFIQYVVDHEKKLELIFKDLDKNQDGYIDIKEIKQYCHSLGIPITDQKAGYIIRKMDQTGSASIDLSEFQKFMLFFPSDKPTDIVSFWRHNLIIDLGEDSQLPEEFSKLEMETGVWWRHLVSGGVAGAASRTCTAPLDRLKVFLQVHSSKANPCGVRQGLRLLYKEGGISSFWRGNGINVMKIAPESAFKFMSYEQMKRLIQRVNHSEELSIYERFLAGSAAGSISQSLIYPVRLF